MPQMSSLKTQEPLPPSELVKILEGDATAKRILEKNIGPAAGDLVGVRLNLNIIKSTGQAVQTIHRATNKMGYKKNQGFYGGEACDYSDVVVLKNAFFNVNQLARHQISSGEKSKFPMASIDGEFVGKDLPQSDECLEVSFNPKNHHLFVDSDGHAIAFAEHVVVFGHRAYCSEKIRYHTSLSAPSKVGDSPSSTKIKDDVTFDPVKKPKVSF